MRRLSKRWGTRTSFRAFNGKDQFVWILRDQGEHAFLNWASIETLQDGSGPYTLDIWNHQNDSWEHHASFPTLKEAKAVGRLLAGIALAQNF